MLFAPALASTCLLASAVLANSPSHHEESQLIERQGGVYDPNFAGAKFKARHKGFATSVSAQFIIPHPDHPADSSAVVGVLLDGDDGCYGVLSGLQMITTTPGKIYYNAVWQVGGNNFNVYPPEHGPTFFGGELVRTTIKAHASRKSFSATITNVNTGKTWSSPQISTPTPACMQYAFWGVLKVTESMPNFGLLELTVRAESNHKIVNAKHSETYAIKHVAGASVSPDGNTVSILG